MTIVVERDPALISGDGRTLGRCVEAASTIEWSQFFPKNVCPEGTEKRSEQLCSDSYLSPLRITITVGCEPP